MGWILYSWIPSKFPFLPWTNRCSCLHQYGYGNIDESVKDFHQSTSDPYAFIMDDPRSVLRVLITAPCCANRIICNGKVKLHYPLSVWRLDFIKHISSFCALEEQRNRTAKLSYSVLFKTTLNSLARSNIAEKKVWMSDLNGILQRTQKDGRSSLGLLLPQFQICHFLTILF